MRIAMISDHADPLAEIGSKEAGGQNIYVYYVAKFLSELGHQVDVYTRWDQKNKKEVVQVNPQWRVIRVQAGPKSYVPRDSCLPLTDEFRDNIIKRIRQEKIKYDLIHANYWMAGLIGMALHYQYGIPLVYVYHSIGQVRLNVMRQYNQLADYVFYRQRLAAEKTIAHVATGIIATSPVEKQIIKQYFEVDSEKITVIPIGIDRTIFFPLTTQQARQQLQWDITNKVVVFVGRLEWRKGIGTLVQAFANVIKAFPSAQLYIIGGAKTKLAVDQELNEQQRLQFIAEQLNISDHLHFLGARKQSELHLYYSAADICAVPSYYEPFGIVPIEAMACGTPVVASKAGGLKYTVVENETGLLAEPFQDKDLSKKLIQVLQKGKAYYTPKCLERIKNNFQWNQIAKKYDHYLKGLLM